MLDNRAAKFDVAPSISNLLFKAPKAFKTIFD
jgi:hypothetical protein